ncbi:MAG TPA: ComEC/Rec2 family competence protein [Candidatus Saccharimonadales bacterium]|nr:ComEC/Rec2 family competence protein [Candidatus Saccharimonadales bacterium]
MLLVGLAIGSKISASATLLGYLLAMWAIVYFSKQEPLIENLSLVLFAVTAGWLIWQLTGGETWLALPFLGKIASALVAWRDRLIGRIFMTLPEPHGSLLTGIIFGNRVKLDKQLLDEFKIIGITHLIAVSGYNLTILTANVRSLFRPILGHRAVYVSLLVIIGFVLMTGAPASILRAAVMAILILAAEFFGRPSRSVNILILGAAALVVFEPKIILDVGFQLSVAATYGLVRLSPVILASIKKIRFPQNLKSIFAETLSACLMTAPIILFYFGRLSLISPLANLLTLPLIPLIMGLGIVGGLVLMVTQVVGRVMVMLSWPLLQWIVWVSDRLSSWKFASTNISLPPLVIVGLVAIIIVGVEWLNWRWQKVEAKSEPKLA